MRVVITEAVNAGLEPLGALAVDERDGIWRDRPALLAAVGGAEGLIVPNQTRVDAELIAAAPVLRVVGRLGAGLDNLDLVALRARHRGGARRWDQRQGGCRICDRRGPRPLSPARAL